MKNNKSASKVNTIIKTGNLTVNEIAVLAILQSYSNFNTSTTFIGIKKIADTAGINYSTAERILKELESKKIIISVYERGKSKKFVINSPDKIIITPRQIKRKRSAEIKRDNNGRFKINQPPATGRELPPVTHGDDLPQLTAATSRTGTGLSNTIKAISKKKNEQSLGEIFNDNRMDNEELWKTLQGKDTVGDVLEMFNDFDLVDRLDEKGIDEARQLLQEYKLAPEVREKINFLLDCRLRKLEFFKNRKLRQMSIIPSV